MAMNIVTGNDGSNVLAGGNGDDLIYGFDPNAPYASATIAATRVASGLDQPLYVTAAPGDTSRLFIVEKTGTIKILDLNSGQVLATPFLTVPVNTASERGLLGLAFDPDYATNGAFYVYATSADATPHNEVWRYHVSGNPNVAAAGRDLILDVGPSTNGNHNAGWLGFGPDGMLYIASGEVGVPPMRRTSPTCSARCCASMWTRSRPATRSRPTIRSSAMGGGVRGEIFAFGLRNPWRASFDSATGNFFIGNVGEGSFEEINLGVKGANYGWPIVEGISAKSGFHQPDLHLSARQRRVGHRRLCLSRRKRRPERPVFLRRLHPEHDLHAAVRWRATGSRPIAPRRSSPTPARSTRRPRSARTRAAISTSSISAARFSG